ncbi:hypothetical protein D3C86_2112630 [compost metagenome]
MIFSGAAGFVLATELAAGVVEAVVVVPLSDEHATTAVDKHTTHASVTICLKLTFIF